MTLSTTTCRVEYTGNGVTKAFSFPYKFLANADLLVYSNGTLQTITTHYTVSGAGAQAGGTVTFVSAPANGVDVVIIRDPAITQSVDYTANDAFPAESHEAALDRLTMVAQRTRDIAERGLILADGLAGVDTSLPTPEASQVIGWNSSADGLQNYDPDDFASGSFTQAGTGAVTRTMQAKAREILSVMDFGAVGDGVTDDGAAINLATARLRTILAAGSSCELVFPAGNYLTSIPLDFTNLRGAGGDHFSRVTGWGATITGTCTGKPIMDFLNTQHCQIEGFAIYGDTTNIPSIGIQIGRGELNGLGNPMTASNISIKFCRTNGYFSKACFASYSSEVHYQQSNTWRNEIDTNLPEVGSLLDPSETLDCAYCMILDGDNVWDFDSDYWTQEIASPKSTSFVVSLFENCSFMRSVAGPTMWISTAVNRMKMVSCYSACKDGDSVVIYVPTYTANPTIYRSIVDWDLDLHCESDGTEGGPSFRNVFRIIPSTIPAGADLTLTWHRFRYLENNAHVDEAVIRFDTECFPTTPYQGYLFLQDSDIKISKFNGSYSETNTDGGPPTLGIFYPDNWASMSGTLSLAAGTSAYSINLAKFNGLYLPRSLSSAYMPYPRGSYQIAVSTSLNGKFKGSIELYGDTNESSEYTGATLQSGKAIKLNTDEGFIANENDVLRMPRLSADPTPDTNTNGAIYYNTTSKKLRGCENGSWRDL